MKPFFLFVMVLGLHTLAAQPLSLSLSIDIANENKMAKVFNTNTVRFYNAIETSNKSGIIIIYQKTDTLSFNHPYFKDEESDVMMHVSQGIAFYSKTAGIYRRQFANPYAFFCASCNNLKFFAVEAHKDTLTIHQSWGPHDVPQTEYYNFIYNKSTTHWPLVEKIALGENVDDEGQVRHEYTLLKPDAGILMDNFDPETLINIPDSKVASHIFLYYKTNKFKALLDSLYKVAQSNFPYLSKVLTAEDAAYFIDGPITGKTVKDANDIGYFLEQANNLPAAEVFLKKVIAAFPKREVAYFNLGDVYVKKSMKKEAANQYAVYIKLMNERGLQQKIPQRLIDFVNDPQNK